MTFDWETLKRIHISGDEMIPWDRDCAIIDLHERLQIVEKLMEPSEDDETLDELVEHYEPSSLALQALAGRTNGRIMHHLWLKERRRADELQSKVDEFVQWVVDLDPYNWSSDQKAFFIAKLRDLGLLKAGGAGDAVHPPKDPNSPNSDNEDSHE